MVKSSNYIIVLIAFFVAFICFSAPKPVGYQLLFTHPVIFGLALLFCEPLKQYKFSRTSLLVLFLTAFIRYVISPLLLVLGDFPQEGINSSEYTHLGIWLMVYEELLVLVLINKYGKKICFQNQNIRNETNYSVMNISPFLLLFVFTGIGVLLLMPEVLHRFHFVLTLKGNEYDYYNENTGYIYSLLVDLGRFILVLIFISYYSKKYLQTKKVKYVYFSVIAIGINMLFVHDISRFSILLPTIVFTYLILQLYPKHRGRILKIVFLFALLSIGFTTLIKMFSESRGGSDNSYDIASWAVTIQQYFMGQRDVGIGLYVADKIPKMGFLNIFNDIISNVIGLNQFYVPALDSLSLYNYEYNQGPWVDKIFPNICAGYTYFGFILSPIITITFVYLSIFFDIKSYTVKSVEYKFLWVYSSLICGFIMMQWYPMIVCILTNNILLLYIIFIINDSLRKR